MPTLADSIVSSSSRHLAIRVRPDLKARRQRYQGRVYWVVKDPVGLQYFRFEEEEFAILQMLTGDVSLEDIAEQFEAEFPPQTIRVEELQNFLGMLYRSGLVISDARGQGDQLKQRHDERRRKELISSFSNILAFRFRGIDPEHILNAMYPWVRWFFSVPALICCLILCTAAATLVAVQFSEFQSRLPSFQTFFSAQNWLLIAGVLGVTKVLHEFGAWDVLQTLRRRVPRNGRDVLGADSLPILQRIRLLDAAEPLAPGRHWRRRDVRRGGARLNLYVYLVVQRRGVPQLPVPEHYVCQFGEHDPVQCEPTAAIRWLLHLERCARSTESTCKSEFDPQPQTPQVVFGT